MNSPKTNEELIERQIMVLAEEYIDAAGGERTAALLKVLAKLLPPARVIAEPTFIHAEEYFSDPSNPTDDEIEKALCNLGDEETWAQPGSLHIVTNSYTDEQTVALRQHITWFLNEVAEHVIVDAHQGQWVVVHRLDEYTHAPGHHELLYFTHREKTGEIRDGWTIIRGLRQP